jgi:hypothetical protein
MPDIFILFYKEIFKFCSYIRFKYCLSHLRAGSMRFEYLQACPSCIYFSPCSCYFLRSWIFIMIFFSSLFFTKKVGTYSTVGTRMCYDSPKLQYSMDRSLNTADFYKLKKGCANLSLGLNYCSIGWSPPQSRDTVPLH